MATTRLIVLHENKGKTILQSLKDRIDYAQNPEKTENGELVTSYECDPHMAAEEFLLSKRNYEQKTGRTGNVLAYQIRQSFRPGEITPEKANQVGRELAMSFTKGKHAFTVSTHTDRKHIHNHIIFNAVALDEERKFVNFFRSNRALHRASDRVCLEHGLSIIEPWQRKTEPMQIMPDPFSGVNSPARNRSMQEPELSLLIDIQKKLQEGKGKGYEIWASRFNLKQMAQVMCFLEENGIGSYEELAERATAASQHFSKISNQIHDINEKMAVLTELRNHIFHYAKTREIYDAYKKSGWNRQFYAEHKEEIQQHRAAKKAFDQLNLKKIPTVKTLNTQFAELAAEKKSLYAEYRKEKKRSRELLVAEKNVATILEMDSEKENCDQRRLNRNSNRQDLER